MEHPFFTIVGAVGDEPTAMAMDTKGPLAQASFPEAVQRVRRALQHHVPPLDTYVRAVRQVPVTEDNPKGEEAFGRSVKDPSRWQSGEEGAQAALSLLGPEKIVHIIQGSPAERRDMVDYMGHTLAPEPQGPVSPFLGPQAPRRAGPTPGR